MPSVFALPMWWPLHLIQNVHNKYKFKNRLRITCIHENRQTSCDHQQHESLADSIHNTYATLMVGAPSCYGAWSIWERNWQNGRPTWLSDNSNDTYRTRTVRAVIYSQLLGEGGNALLIGVGTGLNLISCQVYRLGAFGQVVRICSFRS